MRTGNATVSAMAGRATLRAFAVANAIARVAMSRARGLFPTYTFPLMGNESKTANYTEFV